MPNPPAATDLIDVGQTAPDFTLPDQNDQPHALGDYRGKWVALYFYPKDNTPGCTRQACAFRDADADLKRAGVVVLGVSPDDTASHRRFADKYNLPFPLLADEGAAICQAYGVWQQKSMFGRKYIGVARTTYLIDPSGDVAHRWDKVKVDRHAADVLEEYKRLTK